MRTFTITRAGRFLPPADMKGKWHMANPIVPNPACGSLATLNPAGGALVTRVGDSSDSVHPLVCRRCLAINEARNRRSPDLTC